ncbi:MAG: hypothetical protein LBJ31_12325 [Treponema sp.]|nr:hypothetical protein [Treponema sp.]
MDDMDIFSKRNDDNDYPGNVKIYVENRSEEIIVVFDKDYFEGIELARISIRKVQTINIEKGRTIYISGGNTRKQYMEIICDKDNETYYCFNFYNKEPFPERR